jgi:hypothetical protein
MEGDGGGGVPASKAERLQFELGSSAPSPPVPAVALARRGMGVVGRWHQRQSGGGSSLSSTPSPLLGSFSSCTSDGAGVEGDGDGGVPTS